MDASVENAFGSIKPVPLKPTLPGSPFRQRTLTAMLSKFLWLILVLSSGGTLAQGYSTSYDSEGRDTLGGDRKSLSYLPGEQYDTQYGVMGHYMTDLVFEGNGLPITISRQLQLEPLLNYNRRALPNELAHFRLDIPRLTYTNNSLAGSPGTCRNSRFAGLTGPYGTFSYDLYYYNSQVRNTPFTFHHGKSVVKFFSTAAAAQPGDISRFIAQGADYVSASNWFIRCRQIADSPSGEYRDVYDVYSPDGTIYEMGNGRGHHHYGYRTAFWTSSSDTYNYINSIAWRVTKVTDPYGNSLEYIYEKPDRASGEPSFHPAYQNGGWQSHTPNLLKIVASDGRTVDFSYRAAPSLNSLGNDRTVLVKAVSNGYPNKHTVDYEYSNLGRGSGNIFVTYDDTQTIDYEFEQSGIKNITYPNGGSVSYTYEQSDLDEITIGKSAAGPYHPLLTRTVNNAGVQPALYRYRIDSSESNTETFSRLINTPERTIEYTYGKVNFINPLTGRAGFKVKLNDGKLLSMKDYGRVLADGLPGTNPVFEKSYTYKALSSVTTAFRAITIGNNRNSFVDIPGSMQMEGTTMIVKDVETTTISSLKYPTRKQIFTRSFEAYDSEGFGFPLRIKETSASGKVRYVEKSYKGFSRWIRGKPMTTITREIVGGPALDTKALTYNVYGDVRYSYDNGIRTTTDYWESGFSKGHVKSTSDALGNTYRYAFYYRGVAREEIDERGRRKTTSVNSDGTVSQRTRFGDTSQWGYTYDQARRLKSETSPRNNAAPVSIRWDGVSKKTETQGSMGEWTRETSFDGLGRVLSIRTTALREGANAVQLVKYTYDTLGRKIFELSPGVRNTYTYDTSGRVSRLDKAAKDGTVDRTIYDYASPHNDKLIIAVTDGRSNSTYRYYESYGEPSYEHLVSQTNMLGVVTSYEKDAYGRLHSLNRGGLIRTYSYDENKKLSSEWNPENGSTNYTYYANGWLKKKKNQSNVIDYTYFPDGDVNAIYMSGSGESVTRTNGYDANGNLQTITNESGGKSNSWTYTYNDENNLLSEILSIDDQQFSIKYDYDSLSNVETITYPNGRKYELHPDGFGRPERINELGGKVVYESIRYHPTGSLRTQSRDSHGIVAGRAWQNRLDLLQLYKGAPDEPASSREHHVIQEFEYDAASNLTSIGECVANGLSGMDCRKDSLAYDKTNRLTKVEPGGMAVWSFNYNEQDDIQTVVHGNNVNKYVYNLDRKLLSRIESSNTAIPIRNFAHDKTGSMIQSDGLASDKGIRLRTLTRNSAGQVANLNDGSSTYYEYDGHGLRVKKSRNGAIYSVYDLSGKLRFRVDTNAGAASEYLYAGGVLIARRDVGSGSPVDDSGSGPASPAGITVSGRTISWPDDGWYQVQTSDGSVDVCEGGRSCVVSASGTYKVINHTTGEKSNVVVD